MNKEVEFLKEDILLINKEDILNMKVKADRSPLKKFRYCLHESETSNMQEMLFVNTKGQYLQPHMHKEYAETQIVIEGKLLVLIFNNNGTISQVFEASREDCCIYRVEKGKWHMALPITETIVLYEVREGKFTEKTNTFPSWAPEITDSAKIELFYEKLYKEIDEEKYGKIK